MNDDSGAIATADVGVDLLVGLALPPLQDEIAR